MPSGISHMQLSNYLPIAGSEYRYKFIANKRYFLVGSIGPDLPYAAILDNNIFENESQLANLFHFTEKGQDPALSPNRLPLEGLSRVKSLIQRKRAKRECDALFYFIAGYASHVIADGVFHPFVMDKVGRYEGNNRLEHRALEMGLDVLLTKHFTAKSGQAIEANYAGMDQYIRGFFDRSNYIFTLEQFADLIEQVYGLHTSRDEIEGWISGISRLFGLATGAWPEWLRQLDHTRAFVFRNISDVEHREDEFLLLKKPKYWQNNFIRKSEVHALRDCLPRFNQLMKAFLDKAIAYVYGDRQNLDQQDLQAFSLDTGRTVNHPDKIGLIPVLWE